MTHEPGADHAAPPAPAPWPANGYELQTLVGGNWFSTPAAGQCPAGAAVGTNGCTWRIVDTIRVINASCANARIFAAVQQHALDSGASCFGGCADGHAINPVDPSDCWTEVRVPDCTTPY